ncbi:MAG: hypothetical protein ACLTEE_11310 [Anaerobutyricum hallii]
MNYRRRSLRLRKYLSCDQFSVHPVSEDLSEMQKKNNLETARDIKKPATLMQS